MDKMDKVKELVTTSTGIAALGFLLGLISVLISGNILYSPLSTIFSGIMVGFCYGLFAKFVSGLLPYPIIIIVPAAMVISFIYLQYNYGATGNTMGGTIIDSPWLTIQHTTKNGQFVGDSTMDISYN